MLFGLKYKKNGLGMLAGLGKLVGLGMLVGLGVLGLHPKGVSAQSMGVSAQSNNNIRYVAPPPPDLSAHSWSIKSETGMELTGIKAPFTLYDALWRLKKIAHPYSQQTSDSVQWVEKQIWVCRLDFEVDSLQASRNDGRIVFEEIMTHARVYLNGNRLGVTKNAFHPHSFDVGRLLTVGINRLEVELLPIQRLNDSLSAAHLPLPEGHRTYVRQAAYTFGWDWGPRLAAGGITGAVRMEWIKTPKITLLNHRVLRADTESAEIEAEVRFRSAPAGSRIRLQLSGRDCRLEQSQPMLGRADTVFLTRFVVPKPHLWWTHDLGEPYLYRLTATLYLPDEPENDLYLDPSTERLSQNVGLRTVELVQARDDSGGSFAIQLNGHPLFVRGANMVPGGYLVDTRMNDPQWGRQPETAPLVWARAAHINMLRLWGGGSYPSTSFYHCADSLGILLWQDAAFACAMYPNDSLFRQEVEQELRHQVGRLRSHPSLALWCGNNENFEGWHNWGWQKSLQYTVADSLHVWKGYEQLFMEDIPRLLMELDPGRPYTHSSPLTGWGRAAAYRQGDVHYWGVWWGLDSLEVYARRVGRFVSEYGMQSFPHLATLQQFAGEDEAALFHESPAMKHHQRHPTGTATLNTYMGRDYPPAADPRQYAYLTQLLQQRAMEAAIKAHRSAKPYCMGTLFWQWNDAWPGISWSAVDYFGRPKALYHRLKSHYQPVWVGIDTAEAYGKRQDAFGKGQENNGRRKENNGKGQEAPGRPHLTAVNDTRRSVEVDVTLHLWHFEGQQALKSVQKKIVIAPDAALSDPWPRSVLTDKRLKKPGYFVVVEWRPDGGRPHSQWWVPHRPLQQKWADPRLQVRALGMGLLEVRSQRPARFVHLQMNSRTDDDYFDLLPGQTKIVNFIPHHAETYPPRVQPITFYDLLGSSADGSRGPEH
jgi:beta-mannosidase